MKSCTILIRSAPSFFELTYMLLQNNCINNGLTNGLKWKKKAWRTALYGKTRKATGFKSLRVNCWEINQVASKCEHNFWIKLVKKGLNQKKWTSRRISHIRNSPGTKFQLKIKNLNFWTKLMNRKVVFRI